MLLMVSILWLVSWYLIFCLIRYRYARHYFEPFRLMGPKLMANSLNHMTFHPRWRLFRAIIWLIILLGLFGLTIGVLQ